jgi:protein SCO1/2
MMRVRVQLRLSILPATLALAMAMSLFAPVACAQDSQDVAGVKPPQLNDVGIDPKLAAQVPPDLTFKDENNNTVHLSDYFANRKPTILTLVYFRCPMLCTMVLNDMTAAMKVMPLQPGKDFQVITVSFDPEENPAMAAVKKRNYIREYDRPGADTAWHFLTGQEDQIKKLAASVGFRYAWDPRGNQYVHPSTLIILSPDGKVSRYLYGVEYGASDLRLSIDAAADGKTLNPLENAILYCFHFDPTTGRWGWAVERGLQAGATLTVLAVAGLVLLLLRHERRRRANLEPVPPLPSGNPAA